MKLSEDFPNFTFWFVGAPIDDWLIKSKQKIIDGHFNFEQKSKLFCTLENSISFKVVQQFIKKNGQIISIESGVGYDIDYNFDLHSGAIIFAETKKVYYKKDIEELKRDCIIVELSGLKQ